MVILFLLLLILIQMKLRDLAKAVANLPVNLGILYCRGIDVHPGLPKSGTKEIQSHKRCFKLSIIFFDIFHIVVIL